MIDYFQLLKRNDSFKKIFYIESGSKKICPDWTVFGWARPLLAIKVGLPGLNFGN